MARKPPSAEKVEKAIALATAGESLAKIGAALGVSQTTVRNWLAKAGVPNAEARWRKVAPQPDYSGIGAKVLEEARTELPPEARALPEPDPADVTAADAASDAIAFTRRLLLAAQATARRAEQAGNHSAAQRAGRDALGYVTVLARLEKAETADADVIKMSRREADEAMATVMDRVRAILSRPLLCAHCQRQLSIEFGLGSNELGKATE